MTDIEVKPSPIEGMGVFAARPFRAGQRIRRVNIVREITDDTPIREDAGERIEHCGYPDGRVVLWGFPDRHVNHRCDPNAYELYDGSDIYIVARRDIAAGEEIAFDYNVNTSGGSSWPCNCGAERCRGESVASFLPYPRSTSENTARYSPTGSCAVTATRSRHPTLSSELLYTINVAGSLTRRCP